MKKIMLFALALVGLITAHNLILDNSRQLAEDYVAVPYQPATDDELGLEPPAGMLPGASAADRFGAVVRSQELARTNAAAHQAHYWDYLSARVRPAQQRIEGYARIGFSLAYAVLALFSASSFYRWMQASGGALASGGLRKLSGLTGGLGVKGALRSHQLGRAETEFVRLKNLFDNGLITEEEFLAKKAELTDKIRDDNLLNKS